MVRVFFSWFFMFLFMPLCFSQKDNTEVDVNAYMVNSSSTQVPVRPATNSKIDGDYYLFDEWDNYAMVYSNSKGVKLNSSNYNLWRDAIEFKISKDSVYTISTTFVDSIIINNRLIKKFPENSVEKPRFAEIIFEGDDVVLYKKYYSKIDKSKMNPLTGHYDFADKVEIDSKYFIFINNRVKQIKLRKNNILDVFSNSNDIKEYVKSENLSYKEEQDIKEIFKKFSNTIR